MNNDNQKQQDWNKGESSAGSQQQGGQSGAAAERAQDKGDTPAAGAYKNETGDPGRTPGSAEGVENAEKTGNE